MGSPSKDCTVYGIDIGKSLFHVCGCDRSGKPVFRKKFSCQTVIRFFANTPVAVIGMEACPGSQWLARKLIEHGHDARIMPAQFNPTSTSRRMTPTMLQRSSRPYRGRPCASSPSSGSIRSTRKHFTALESDWCDSAPSSCRRLAAYALNTDSPSLRGCQRFAGDMPRLLENPDNALTPRMLRILQALWEEFLLLNDRVNAVSEEIKAIARHDETARRLMSVPGIGELTASAIVSSVGCPQNFKRGRDLAAWIGTFSALNRWQHKTAWNIQTRQSVS